MRIGYITPHESDPLAFYRGSGPLSKLVRNHDASFDFLPHELNWARLINYDLIFIQRPYTPEHLKICELANKFRIPIVGDFDDWLYELNEANPAYKHYQKNQKSFAAIVNCLDRIFVTTDKLKELVRTLLLNQEKPIDVIPNAYDVDLFSNYRHLKNVKPRKMIFAWRGGNSHMEDIYSVKEDYINLFQSYPEWQFYFIAQKPWFLNFKKHSNVQTADPLDVIDYMRALHDTAPAILAHPLSDNDFNRSKSMCSWLEATHARAAFIGPDFEEFNQAGITKYGKEKSFFQAASELLSVPQEVATKYWESEKHMMEHFTLEKINQKRFQAFLEAIK